MSPPRRSGWTELPIRCPRCADHGQTSRIADAPLVMHGGGLRCTRCNALLYALVVVKVRLAFVAEVTFADLQRMESEEMTAEQTLAYLGAGFPYSQRAA